MEPAPKTAAASEATVMAAARKLAALRGKPCLLFVSPFINEETVFAVHEKCRVHGHRTAALDLVVHSPGGYVRHAYLVARELRRRFRSIAVFVPVQATSAAALICLAADEIILGALGELGPLDAQFEEKQKDDLPEERSAMTTFRTFDQLNGLAKDLFSEVLGAFVENGVRLPEASRNATDLTGILYRDLYAKIDPSHVAEAARGQEQGMYYIERLLKRYRPHGFSDKTREAVHALVHDYPAHDFVVDLEELQELGFPARRAAGGEIQALDDLAQGLRALSAGRPADEAEEAGPSIIEFLSPGRNGARRPAVRRHPAKPRNHAEGNGKRNRVRPAAAGVKNGR